ncbi:SDR family NAD(P)-dependent oxidoreductase, partial [Proteus mirabilis]|uniref:SDR family NAD(P)-dependent oxidoreductase n=2 Tax=Enterobacterales TaxID=91347 RepID=UPI0013D024E5
MTGTDFWKSQKVIITAGATGIGLKIAAAMHAAGAKVWICDIAEAQLAEAAAALPGLGTMTCDVADPA